MRSIFGPNPALSNASGSRSAEPSNELSLLPGRFQVPRGQRYPWSLIIKDEAGDPETSLSMHNLERIDAIDEAREWVNDSLKFSPFAGLRPASNDAKSKIKRFRIVKARHLARSQQEPTLPSLIDIRFH
jgi:hypothetical protein